MRTLLTGLWGVLITVVTLIVMYGQYGAALGDQRPILDLQKIESSAEVTEAYGKFSHYYVVKNFGKVTAHEVKFTVRTLRDGIEVHRDNAHNVGALAPTNEMTYEIYVHDHHMEQFDSSREKLTEEVTISYKGEKTPLRFWCIPGYMVTLVLHFHPVYKKWLHHPDRPAIFADECA